MRETKQSLLLYQVGDGFLLMLMVTSVQVQDQHRGNTVFEKTKRKYTKKTPQLRVRKKFSRLTFASLVCDIAVVILLSRVLRGVQLFRVVY